MKYLKIALNDAEKSLSKRPKQKNSCTVIATSIAFGITYDAAFDLMQIHGRENNKGMHYNSFLRQYKSYCHEINYPANMRISELGDILPSVGKYIVLVDSHVFVYMDGVIHDCNPVFGEGFVYGMYKVIRDMDFGDVLADAL